MNGREEINLEMVRQDPHEAVRRLGRKLVVALLRDQEGASISQVRVTTNLVADWLEAYCEEYENKPGLGKPWKSRELPQEPETIAKLIEEDYPMIRVTDESGTSVLALIRPTLERTYQALLRTTNVQLSGGEVIAR